MAAPTRQATQLADDLWLLDTLFQGEPGVIASYLLVGPTGLSLVDVGSAASVEQLLDAVHEGGFDPEQITQLLITHVHLDHASASGTLVRRLPNARVFVHRIGAPHLIDPTKLLSSAARIYGEQMETLWGHMEAVPEDRLTMLEDGDEVRAGNRTLRALYTPGHAIHHVAFADAANAEIFAGDVAGVRIQGVDYARPPTPPPDLNLEEWEASIQKLLALEPREIYVAHFGPVGRPRAQLTELSARLRAWGELLLPGIRAGESDQQLAETLARASDDEIMACAHIDGEAAVTRYELATNYLMSAQGYVRYYRKHHPELLA